MNQLLMPIIPPGINSYRVVELYTKYRPVVLEDYWEDKLHLKPSGKVLKKFKEEKVIQKDNRAKVKAIKEGGGVNEGGDNEIKEEMKKMNLAQLKLALKSHGLNVDGLKGDLQARLHAHLRLHEEFTSGRVAALHPSSEPTNTKDHPLHYRHHNEIKVDWFILSISTFDVALPGRQPPKRVNPAWLG